MSLVTISQRFDRLPFTGYQRRLSWILSLCFAVDAVDLAMMSYLLAPISQDLQLSIRESALAGSSVFVGVGIGATVAGFLADRLGRRRVLVYTMMLWGIASLLTALAWDLRSFILFRFITGLGLGAELPAAYALAAELMPPTRRASLSGWMHVASQSGAVLFNVIAYVSATLVGGDLAWRFMFGLMVLVAILAMYARRNLPESPRWYEASGRHQDAEDAMAAFEKRVENAWGRPLPNIVTARLSRQRPESRIGFRALFSDGYGTRTLFVWAMWFIVLIGFYGIGVWVGKFLVDRGMDVSRSIAVGVAITSFGIPAAWVSGYLMERIGRKPVMVCSLISVAGAALAYANVEMLPLIIISGGMMHFSLVSTATCLYAYTPELFPTRTRSVGLGTASTVGRIAAVTGPLLVPPLVYSWGYSGAFAGFACCFILAALLIGIYGPETRARSLEEISA